jgi:hypothetical protein
VTTTRGTTNRNQRGGSDDRRRRREWLVETFRADMDVLICYQLFDNDERRVSTITDWPADRFVPADLPHYTYEVHKACRCFRCGKLLTVDTVTVDRITPGCKGGTYRRNNIRPACSPCNSELGGKLAGQGKKR